MMLVKHVSLRKVVTNSKSHNLLEPLPVDCWFKFSYQNCGMSQKVKAMIYILKYSSWSSCVRTQKNMTNPEK